MADMKGFMSSIGTKEKAPDATQAVAAEAYNSDSDDDSVVSGHSSASSSPHQGSSAHLKKVIKCKCIVRVT